MVSACCGPQRPEVRGPHEAPAVARRDTPVGDLVTLPGGRFLMGTDDVEGFPDDREGPVREVAVAGFAIGRYAVSNAEFAAFVADTGYRTDAERFGWSYVFARFLPAALRKASPRPEEAPWWCGVEGASWRAPEGPGSDAGDRQDHPAVHVSWWDASEYAAWAGGRLPTEAEWEYAARGGLRQARYPWGDELRPGGRHMCNIWQGHFPVRNTEDDGYAGTAPVDAFDSNGYGLHNVAGNVWEWCAENFGAGTGPEGARVMRGGSYLCHESYCNRYRVAARSGNDPASGGGNNGFRLAADVGGA